MKYVLLLKKMTVELKKILLVSLTGNVIFKGDNGVFKVIYTCRCGHLQSCSLRNKEFLKAIVQTNVAQDCDECEMNANGLGV